MLSGWTMVFTIVWQQLCGVQNRLFLGISSTKQSCACMLGWGPRHKMQAVLTYIWREA